MLLNYQIENVFEIISLMKINAKKLQKNDKNLQKERTKTI